MNPEAQRIAIAEICFDALIKRDGMELYQRPPHAAGYRGIPIGGCWIYKLREGSFYGFNYDTKEACRTGNIKDIADKKNYPEDLNAMHEAESQAIDPHHIEKYASELYMAVERFWTADRWVKFGRLQINFALAHSTAAQRAEAFLRTLNLWKDESHDP